MMTRKNNLMPIDQDDTSCTDIASTYLPDNPEDQEQFAVILNALGVNYGFPYVVNMVNEVSRDLDIYCLYENADKVALGLLDIFKKAKKNIGKGKLKTVTQNSMSGAKGKYTVAYALSMTTAPRIWVTSLLKVWLILSCLRREGISISNKQKLAQQISLSSKAKDNRHGLAKLLSNDLDPKQGGSIENAIPKLRKYIDTHLSENTQLDSKHSTWLKAVRPFLKIPIPHKIDNTRTSEISIPVIKNVDTQDKPSAGNDVTFQSSIMSKVSVDKESNDVVEDGGSLIADSGDLIKSEPDYAIEFEINSNFSPGVVMAEVNRSSGWMTNNAKRAPLSTVRFNTIEREDFQTKLAKSRLATDRSQIEISLIIHLMYGLGLTLIEANNLSIGPKGDLSLDGVFRRKIITPPQALNVSGIDASLLERKAPRIDLPIHWATTQQLKSVAPENGRLFDSLTLNLEEQNEEVISLLSDWRENGRYRHTFQRVSSALQAELAVRQENLFVTHILSGAAHHANPTLQYYQAISLPTLLAIWKKTTEQLHEG
jgi:hypothetical protein